MANATNLTRFASLIFAGMAIIFGCGPSREEAAIARIKNRRPPGLVRVVNLTDAPVDYAFDAAKTSQSASPSHATPFVPMPAGSHEVNVSVAGKSLAKASAEFGDREHQTAFLFKAGGTYKLVFVKGEPYQAKAGSVALAAILVTEGTESGNVTINGLPAGKVKALEAAPLSGVTAGSADFAVTLGNASGKAKLDLEDGTAYSLVAFPRGSKVDLAILQNSSGKPEMMGAAPG